MKLNPLGPNQTILILNNGNQVFFSYSTPVAAYIPEKGFIRTSDWHSTTTTRHIHKFIGEAEATEVPQAEIDALVN